MPVTSVAQHPYPDHAYLERDAETNEKRWYSSKGMGVGYVHEDRVAEEIKKAVAAEREACAALAETFFDGKTDNISCHQANGADKIAKAIRNRTSRARHGQRFKRAR